MLTSIARRFGVPIIEDDPYGLLPEDAPPAFAALAPELTWHIAGLAKCLGAGLRVAYVVVPDNRSGWSFAASLRAATVMASPVTVALATRWINDGTGDALLAAVRRESAERQSLARSLLRGTNSARIRQGFICGCRCRRRGPGRRLSGTCGPPVSGSWPATRSLPARPPERSGLPGRPADRAQVREALEFMAHALDGSPSMASSFL